MFYRVFVGEIDKMYFEKMKTNLMTARLSKVTPLVELYSYLIGQATLKTKTPSDDDVFAIIKAYIKSLKAVDTNNQEYIDKRTSELAELDNFLPKQLSNTDIKDILNTIDYSDFKNVTKHFKDSYSGQYNPGDLRSAWVELKG